MANVKIYYLNLDQDNCTDQILYRERDLYDNRYVYTQCPVFNHKSNRTFVGFSPIDFELKIDKINKRIVSNMSEYVYCDDEHLFSPNPVIQLTFPKFLFWTEEFDVWFEYKDHPMTSLNNNFIGVGGWFNISNWPRSMSNAFTVVDEEKSVIIKRGDPLFRVSFYPSNLDSGIILKKVTDSKKVNQIINQYHSKDKNKKNWKTKLFSKTGIKTCPFKFLYDK